MDSVSEITQVWQSRELAPSVNSVSAQALARIRFPGYEILGVLGSGGAGLVFQAKQVQLNRLVALKIFLPQSADFAPSAESMLIEAQSLAKLNHPNIVQVYDVGQTEGHFFLAMEFVEGGTLARHCAGACQPVSQAALIVETLARAVQVAHDQGIVHRDLKPGNILLTREGSPKIADFGLAHLVSEHQEKTIAHAISGTPNYMSPEQFHGKGAQHLPGTDIYALGVILYELLVGRPPYRGNSLLEMMRAATLTEIVPPGQLRKDLPRDLEAICCKCLLLNPDRRYPSASALADDLRRFQMGEPVSARKLAWPVRLWRWLHRHPKQFRLATTFLAAGIAVAELEYFGYGVIFRRSADAVPLRPVTDPSLTRPYRVTLSIHRHASHPADIETFEFEFAGERYWSGCYRLEVTGKPREQSTIHQLTVMAPELGEIDAVYLSRQSPESDCGSLDVNLQIFDPMSQSRWNFQSQTWRRLENSNSGRCICKLERAVPVLHGQ